MRVVASVVALVHACRITRTGSEPQVHAVSTEMGARRIQSCLVKMVRVGAEGCRVCVWPVEGTVPVLEASLPLSDNGWYFAMAVPSGWVPSCTVPSLYRTVPSLYRTVPSIAASYRTAAVPYRTVHRCTVVYRRCTVAYRRCTVPYHPNTTPVPCVVPRSLVTSDYVGKLQERLDNQYRACCALYNLLHEYDGYTGSVRWASTLAHAREVSADIIDPVANRAPCADALHDAYMAERLTDAEAATLRAIYHRQERLCSARTAFAMDIIARDFDASGVGFMPATHTPLIVDPLADPDGVLTDSAECLQGWGELRRKLVTHYTYARAKKRVFWLF